jgi:hypothetical protein
VDAPGGNIRDQFQILPFKEPSADIISTYGLLRRGRKPICRYFRPNDRRYELTSTSRNDCCTIRTGFMSNVGGTKNVVITL